MQLMRSVKYCCSVLSYLVNVSSSATYKSISPTTGTKDYYTNNDAGTSGFGHGYVIMGTPSISKSGKTITITIPETIRVLNRVDTNYYKDTARNIKVTFELN